MKKYRLAAGDLARAKGWNLSKFGHRAELAQNSARDWYYGTVNRFDGDVLERVADALGVSIADLFVERDAGELDHADNEEAGQPE